ncbi:hypothetical protein FA13DRAFT_1756766 [Coprinellus micaceus]|uniref:Xylanolytic transcriptional activator regulatory domain-containing protein n=1 Tax=Coprinellus micaceus TaxID=71717 RepID=A0A4Y7SSM5_COPMI|nr:hypothetical protein FA13DRAFT_1756766 [Coprinellus micaceus]
MPPEPKQAKLRRKASRKELDEFRFDGTHARELELKRNRGPTLTLFVRPTQTQDQMRQANPMSIVHSSSAATEHLHKRIAKLSTRVRLLEDALASLQSKHSTEPHPLLHAELLSASHQLTGAAGPSSREGGEGQLGRGENGEIIDAFGTLSISQHGVARFFGPTGGSESFPFTPLGTPPDVQEMIERQHLPEEERALGYCKVYFEQALTRGQVVAEMLPAIYKRGLDEEEWAGPHDLALLFMVFAIGALAGGGVHILASNPPLAEHFYQIARACLSLQPVLEKPSIVTIQSLHLMSVYGAMSGSDMRSETSMEMTWSLITMAAHLGQTIGLHRDSARWGLSPRMVQRRRILFWDLFVADTWQSLNTDELWSFRFAAEVVAEVTARTLTAEGPSYATIMELDRKVREFPLPESMQQRGAKMGEGEANDAGGDYVTSFQKCVLDHIRETILLYIHRSFFAQAIIDHPENPLKSAYAPSFLASYRASSTILEVSARFWTMWTFAFTAAVVFGTVVTRGPRSPLAKSAMRELEQACVLFSKAAIYSTRATKALPILRKLNEKAHYALQAAQANDQDAGIHWSVKQEDTEDELRIFAGAHALRLGGGSDRAQSGGPTETATPNTVTGAPGGSGMVGVGVGVGVGGGGCPKLDSQPSARLPPPALTLPPPEYGPTSSGLFHSQQQAGPSSCGDPHTATAVPPPDRAAYRAWDAVLRDAAAWEWWDADVWRFGRFEDGYLGALTTAAGRWSNSASAGMGRWIIRQHQQQSYAPYTAPPEPRRSIPGLQAFDWSAAPVGRDVFVPDRRRRYPNSSSEEVSSNVGLGGSGEYGYHPSPQQQQQHHPQQHHHQSSHPYHQTQQHSHSQQQHHHQHQHQPPTPTTPQYHPMYSAFGASPPPAMTTRMSTSGAGGPSAMAGVQHVAATNADLADLGIASSDSRLDEKWSMFMSESGILEPGFRG